MPPRTQALIEKVRGQHVALAVAAHHPCNKFLAGPLRPYDVQHFNDMLELAGSALCKLAPVYVSLSSVFIRRRDLRQATAVLNRLGMRQLAPRQVQ